MGVTTIATGLMVGASLLSIDASNKAANETSKANKMEADRIGVEKKAAEEKRKKAIDEQRLQMGLGSEKFKTLGQNSLLGNSVEGTPSLLEVLG